MDVHEQRVHRFSPQNPTNKPQRSVGHQDRALLLLLLLLLLLQLLLLPPRLLLLLLYCYCCCYSTAIATAIRPTPAADRALVPTPDLSLIHI